MKRYRTIVADPPWKQKAGPMSAGGMGEGFVGGSSRSADLPYPTLDLFQIAALPVSDLAAWDAHLYLWVTNRHLPTAFELLKGWGGFGYSTTLVWKKKLMGGGLGGAFGISTEFILFSRRGSLPAKRRFPGTCFEWKRPYDERGKPQHSAKPPEFIEEVVETVSPGPYLEMFSRASEPRSGWDYWGDESLQTVELPEAAA